MDRLILLRHGKADADADAPSGQDFDRALTERGRRDTLLVCKAMAEAGVYPDMVLVSPAARAMETWQAAATVFSRAAFKAVPALYDIAPHEILDLARREGAAVGAVMVVGHNPGLGSLAAQLARDVRAGSALLVQIGMGFPTAAAAAIDFSPPAFSLYAPKALGGGL